VSSPSRRPAAVLLSLLLVATACAGGSATTRSGALRVWIMEPGSPDLKAFLTRASADFEQSRPGARVALQFVPWASAHDQFVTAIGGGSAPDVAEMGSTWTPEFGDIGALVPTADRLDGYVPSLVDGATVGGKIYGLPWYAGVRALVYRKDVLAGLGLDPPATWDQLLAVGRAVRDRAHMFAFGVAGNAAHYFLPMVWQNGAEIATRKNGTWVSGMDSPRAVAAIQFYADLYAKEHFAPAGALSWNARDVRAAFEAGDLAMMIGGGWDVRAMLAAHPDLAAKVGTTLLPAGPSGSRDAFAGGSHLVVFEGTRHEDLARRYIRFLLDPARVAAFAERIGFLPGERAGLAGDPESAEPLYAPFTAQLEDHSRAYPPARQWGGFEADGLFTNAIQQVMGGKRSAQVAMAGLARAMNQAFNE
jgi:N,N'-diacetylchitobiose transport system substrate-binding protein